MPRAPKTLFLTTPIYYVNARPHIGHAYTTIVADVLARHSRTQGTDTFFLTGTDEHGQKIQRSASAAGIEPQQFADQVSAEFRGLWDRMGLTYDRFIRTTEPDHKRGAQKLFAELYRRQAIYLSSYTGQYCVSEELFVEGPPGTIGPDGKPTETVTEENFFFRLSDYQRPLIDLIESNTLAVTPEARKNEVLSFLRGNVVEARSGGLSVAHSAQGHAYVPGTLRDLSVSRTSFSWGIPVPEPAASETEKKHVMYVWLDALANYLTAVGYGLDTPEAAATFDKYWPADLHIMAKEITRQHCIYWPAFLLAAGLELPKAIVAHGWLLFDDAKMSKSKGNIVRTETILDAFGTLCPAPPPAVTLREHTASKDPATPSPAPASNHFLPPTKTQQDRFATDVLRYFLLREIPFGQDGSFSFDSLITRYNADLANGYGNLVSRTLSMIQKYFGGSIPNPRFEETPEFTAAPDGFDVSHIGVAASALQKRLAGLGATDFTTALTEIAAFVTVIDGFLSSSAPWKLAKDPAMADRLSTVLYLSAEAIRWVTGLLYPFCPSVTARVWCQLGLEDIDDAARDGELAHMTWGGLLPGTQLGPLSPIFPRADKGLAQIMTDMEHEKNLLKAAEQIAIGSAPPSTESAVNLSPEPLPTDPAAGPRTSTFAEPDPGLQVAGSNATTTERVDTPPHTEAASGIFAHQPTDASPQITIDDFAKVELRVARILVAERIPKADKLLRLEVDLGYEKRQILSGIAEWYTPEDLIGRRIVVITNLAPRKMRGLESHGMLLAASAPEGGKPILATFPDGAELPLGSRLK